MVVKFFNFTAWSKLAIFYQIALEWISFIVGLSNLLNNTMLLYFDSQLILN